ncbi:MAG: copper homeostasis protein CutC [Candidatus Acidiferrum sp.]
MTKKLLLEIAVETVEAAVAAERGGADRVELCADLSVGGITPDAELLRAVRAQIQIPIFVMIRPRPGDFVYSAAEFEEMKASIANAKFLGADGLVLGILKRHNSVDIQRTRELVSLAKPLPVTFHRAFDECADLSQALDDVVQTGAERILTSGGATTALEGANNIASLVAAAGERITIIPGAGINAENILQVAATTRAREFHSGLSSALPYPRTDYAAFEHGVRELVGKLRSVT